MFEKVRDILAEQLEINPDTITMETNIMEDLGADSLDVVELIMALESEFGIMINDETAATLVTVSEIVKFLENLEG
ncbi:MAG: acyl carrier protein [Oscillospiraceae bacterium]|nr:acyl carrier protein [Oscillospiraceae bacterium]